ncbi:unnamed protein product, partial [Symbiodinium pilosum]
MDLQRKARQPKVDLTLAQVRFLEAFLQDDTQSLIDRCASGAILFALFSRSMASDLRVCEDWRVDLSLEDPSADGFIECTTRSHKAARQVAVQAVSVPLVAAGRGVCNVCWAMVWCRVADLVGLGFKDRQKGPVLPAPRADGAWSARSVTSGELCSWLKGILAKGGLDCPGIGSHSLKHTSLAWCSKFGMGKYSRTLLGHHSSGKNSVKAYARDVLAPALLEYCRMLGQIRKGLFVPDSSRSGRFMNSLSEPLGPPNPAIGRSEVMSDIAPFEEGWADLGEHRHDQFSEPLALEQKWYAGAGSQPGSVQGSQAAQSDVALPEEDSESSSSLSSEVPEGIGATVRRRAVPAISIASKLVGLVTAETDALKTAGINSLARLAFALCPPGQTPSDTQVEQVLGNPASGVSAGTKAAVKRLVFEAHTLIVAELQQKVKHGDEGVASTLAHA